MEISGWCNGLLWVARMIAVLLAGVGVLLLCGQGAAARWGFGWLFGLTPQDQLMVTLVLGGALLLLLGWFWEHWGSWADVEIAGVFVVCCLFLFRTHPKWVLGAALILPVLLFVLGSHRKVRGKGGDIRTAH